MSFDWTQRGSRVVGSAPGAADSKSARLARLAQFPFSPAARPTPMVNGYRVTRSIVPGLAEPVAEPSRVWTSLQMGDTVTACGSASVASGSGSRRADRSSVYLSGPRRAALRSRTRIFAESRAVIGTPHWSC